MTSPRTRIVLFCSALALAATTGVLSAGPLDPPPGPVTSTGKSLAEVEPRIAVNATNTPGDADSLFKITQPGSYYLTGNITGVAGKHGIEIAASGVTLDLNGFDLAGLPAMGAFDGVRVTLSAQTNIAVVNGSVRNWGRDGVDLQSLIALGCRVEAVQTSGNAVAGIAVAHGSRVSNCSAYANTSVGIEAAEGCTVSNCSAYANTGAGISVSTGCTVSNCSVTANTGAGISASTGCTISNCSSSGNSGSGISALSGSTIVGCTVRSNVLDGIRCVLACVIRGNTCTANGSDGAGIHATSSDNRIESNFCTSAGRGIEADAAGNIIIGNTCSGNTVNWDIAANNYYGPIIDRTGAATAAVNGSAAASTLATTDPHANFSY